MVICAYEQQLNKIVRNKIEENYTLMLSKEMKQNYYYVHRKWDSKYFK